MATRHTPARRARARRDPAVFEPPPRVRGTIKTSLRKLTLISRGRTYLIGEHIVNDNPWSLGMDQSAQIQLELRDPAATIVKILEDESHLQQDGVVVPIDGVEYVVAGVESDGSLYTLQLEDYVSWQLKQFSSYKQASRARSTRFGFIQSLVDEASRKPYTRIRSFIPEQYDKQKILKPKS